ncbi:MAG: hypothetical protein Q9190_002680 [Brigantiaea leucoxantha]
MAIVEEPQRPASIHEKPIINENGTANGSVSTHTKLTVDGSTKPTRTPFINPSPESKPPPTPPLAADQSSKYDQLLSTVSSWTEKPSSSTNPNSSPKLPLTDSDRLFLTRECLLRYLRATKWSLPDASSRLLSTLTWRHEYGLERHTAEYISPENATGKQVILGYDNDGRPCLYLNPLKQNTERSTKQVEALVYMVERAIDLMPPGQETLALLVNFEKRMGQDRVPLWQGKMVLNILQSHYPERLGRALVVNVPWLLWTFFKLLNPFIDANTREKLKFEQGMLPFVPRSQLLDIHGGDVTFEYDHEVYWPALNNLAEEKRKGMMERWIKGGKKVGESEAFLRGGVGGDGEI